MKFARIATPHGPRFATLTTDNTAVELLDAAVTITDLRAAAHAGEPLPTGERLPLDEVELLVPCTPSKILALGCAYLADPAESFDPAVHNPPFIFLKPPSALIATGETIEVPAPAHGALFESELAIVIGKRGKAISTEDALDYVLGYTICNDVSAPPLMQADGQWSRGKGLDTFCPLGPWIDTDIDGDNALITASLSRRGEDAPRDLVHQATDTLIWSIAETIAYCSEFITLEPGDVISTGCPPGPIALADGDEVAITIAGIGTLTNPVRLLD